MKNQWSKPWEAFVEEQLDGESDSEDLVNFEFAMTDYPDDSDYDDDAPEEDEEEIEYETDIQLMAIDLKHDELYYWNEEGEYWVLVNYLDNNNLPRKENNLFLISSNTSILTS